MIRRSIRNTLAVTALAGAALAAAAAPSWADTNPSASAQATVNVALSISFAFNSPTSFSLSPGVTAHNAIAFTITTNDNHGYSLALSAPDPTTGNASFPATSLVYSTFQGGANVGTPNQQLSNGPAVVLTTSGMSPANGDSYSQDWTADLPGNTLPGAYATTLTYVATAR